MPFGKYKGVALAAVLREEPSYLCWFMETVEGCRDVKKAIAEPARLPEGVGEVLRAEAPQGTDDTADGRGDRAEDVRRRAGPARKRLRSPNNSTTCATGCSTSLDRQMPRSWRSSRDGTTGSTCRAARTWIARRPETSSTGSRCVTKGLPAGLTSPGSSRRRPTCRRCRWRSWRRWTRRCTTAGNAMTTNHGKRSSPGPASTSRGRWRSGGRPPEASRAAAGCDRRAARSPVGGRRGTCRGRPPTDRRQIRWSERSRVGAECRLRPGRRLLLSPPCRRGTRQNAELHDVEGDRAGAGSDPKRMDTLRPSRSHVQFCRGGHHHGHVEDVLHVAVDRLHRAVVLGDGVLAMDAVEPEQGVPQRRAPSCTTACSTGSSR